MYCAIPTVGHSGEGETVETAEGCGAARGEGQRAVNGRSSQEFWAVRLLCRGCGGGHTASHVLTQSAQQQGGPEGQLWTLGDDVEAR